METTEINNLRRIVADLRAASLHTTDMRLSVCTDLCALAIDRELHDLTREPIGVDVLDRDSDPVRLIRDFPVFVEGKAVRP